MDASRERGGSLSSARGRVPRERTPRAGARGHVRARTVRLTQSAIIIYFFRGARAEPEGGARRKCNRPEAVTHRSAIPLSTTPDTRLSHYDTSSIMVCNEDKVRGHEAQRCTRDWSCVNSGRTEFRHHLYPAMVWLSRSRERRVIPARSVERQSRGRPHGGAPQWRGDRAHSRGARRPHGHWLWSFP